MTRAGRSILSSGPAAENGRPRWRAVRVHLPNTEQADCRGGGRLGSLTISRYRVKPNGQPVLLAAVAAMTGAAPIDMTESGGFLCVESGRGGFVEVYAVSSDGSLTLLQKVTDGLPVFNGTIGIEGIAAS
jgi:hypothetical protein